MRNALAFAAVCALVVLAPRTVEAQSPPYEGKTITIVVGYKPGGGYDATARLLARHLPKHIPGSPTIIVQNMPGANSIIGANHVYVVAKPDGLTLGTFNRNLPIAQLLDVAGVKFDMTKYAWIGSASSEATILAIRSDLPYKNFAEMVDYAKKNPGTVRVGTAGAGTVGDFTVAIVNSLTGAGITMVPFKGAAPAVTAARGGFVEGVALALGVVSGHLKSGALKGILTSSKFPEFPDTPTLTGLGYKQDLFGLWLGFYAPAGVPAEVIEALVPAVEKAAKDPSIAAKFLNLGMVQGYAPPEAMMKELREELVTIEDIAKKSGIIK